MLAEHVDHVIGIDPDRDRITAAVVTSGNGGVIEVAEFATTADGDRRLVAWADHHSHPGSRAWSIEGAGSYGAGTCEHLDTRGEWVIEFDRPTVSTRKDRAKTALLRWRIIAATSEGRRMKPPRVDRRSPASSFVGYRFPPEVILLPVRWYLRYGLSYRDVEELLAERGVEVDHGTIYRWVQRFTPLLIDAARPCRHGVGDRWFVDETYVRDGGVWCYVYRAVDQHGQVIDVFVSKRRNTAAARHFFDAILDAHGRPAEVTTDLAAPLPRVVDEVLFDAAHDTEQYANNRVECDHGRLKARLRPMRGLKHDRTASAVIRGHALIQNLRRGHYELGVNARSRQLRIAAAFDELATVI